MSSGATPPSEVCAQVSTGPTVMYLSTCRRVSFRIPFSPLWKDLSKVFLK
jgi:hypothetical protein